MKATIYVLSSELHWYKHKEYPEVTPEQLKQLEAYQEEYQGQVRVEYTTDK